MAIVKTFTIDRYATSAIIPLTPETIRHPSEDWGRLWPREFPWAVLGVIVQKKEDIDKGLKAYLWLLPPYLYYKELTLYHFISDVELAAVKL
ncbi:hypothetical protein Y032_0033g2695 [Ancylostoma ceylanicum]|nr:hypothetical protein Y032_0033g2695 [Ancylostoma ceylanicum]